LPNVLVFTDQPVLAKGLSSVLSSVPDFDEVSIFHSFEQLLQVSTGMQTYVLLLDVTPEITLASLAELQKRAPQSRIVLWVYTITPELAYQSIRVGVRGLLRKTLSTSAVVRALQRIAMGEYWFEEALTASLGGKAAVALTNRENQIVALLSQGLKNKELAYALNISEGTAKVYLSKLFRKVGVKDRYELALYGMRNLAGSQAVLGNGAQLAFTHKKAFRPQINADERG
jgi:DNA-binding NarL/FixJ family response regulator